MTITKWNIAPLLIALGLIAGTLIKVGINGKWASEWQSLTFLFIGFVMFAFSDIFAEYTGHYGWTREQWFQSPTWYIKLVGGIMLACHANGILNLI